MVKRLVFVLLGALVIALVMTSAAMAATTEEIYNDFADDGQLNGTKAPYLDQDLRSYLNDATLHQYGNPTIIDRLDDRVNEELTRDTFPFTGFQLMIAGVVAVILVGGGIALRRLSRSQKS